MKHVLSLRNTISLILALTVLASVAILPVSASPVLAPSADFFQWPWPLGQSGQITQGPHSTNNSGLDINQTSLNWNSGVIQEVRAAAGGTVTTATSCYVVVDHGNGWSTGYVHIHTQVSQNQVLTANQLIGHIETNQAAAQCSGTSTGPHLHFRLFYNGVEHSIIGTTFGGWLIDVENGYPANNTSSLYIKNGVTNHIYTLLDNPSGICSGGPGICTPLAFSTNAHARQYFDRGNGSLNNESLNLEVCADNLAGHTLYVKSWRISGFLPGQSAQAVGNCYTFLNLDGNGAAFTDVPYKTWVSMGDWPDENWGTPCLESTSRLGMCTQAQYPSESIDPVVGNPSPAVISIVRNDANPTEALSVDYLVTFSEESILDVGIEDFALTTGTISGAYIVSVNPTNERMKEFIVTVNTGTGDGELRLDVPSSATITDLGGKPLIELPFNSGESYAISKLPPTVVSSLRANPNPTNAVNVGYTVTFSESVTGVEAGDFKLTITGAITGESVTAVSGGPKIYTVSAKTGRGDGNLRLDLVNATITDLAGKSLSGLPYTSGESYTIDKTSPLVLSSVRTNPNPNNLPSVDFTVTFSESVTGVDINDFALAKTGTISGESVTNVSGGPSVYTVGVNTGTGDGGLGLYLPNGATVADIAGNLLTALPYPDGESYTVDKTAPMVEITLSNPNHTNLGGVYFNAAFSEPVTDGTFEELFVLTTTGMLKDVFFTNGGGDWTSLSVGVNTGTGDGYLCLKVKDTVTDLAGNSIILPVIIPVEPPLEINKCYKVDKTAPTVVSIVRVNPSPTNLPSVDFTVTFSESVTGVDVTDFAIAKTGTISGESVTGISGGPSVYTVSVNTGDVDVYGDLRLDMPGSATVNDLTGNTLAGLPYTSGESYMVDKSAPTVDSIIPENENFIVTFHESVTGVDISDFVLIKTGTIIGEKITGVSGGPITYTISINSGTGSGDLNLNLSSVGVTINDLAGNPLTETQCNKCRNIRVYRVEFTSGGSSDGWVLESKENSNVGGSKNSDDGIIKLGDDTQNRQFRAILHFPTYYLPDNAVVTQVSLIIKKEGIVGANPFDTHGNLLVDIHNGLFANFDLLGLLGYGSLPVKNFQADADVYSVGEIKNTSFKDWYGTILDSRAYPIINLNGLTQIRLGFQLDDNNDNGDNYIRFYSGDAVDLKNRPHLQIQYYLP